MDRAITYSAIEDISLWSKSKVIDSDCRFCIRIVTNDCIYFFQVKHLIDFLLSGKHKCRWKLLFSSFRLIRFTCETNGSIQFNGKYVIRHRLLSSSLLYFL